MESEWVRGTRPNFVLKSFFSGDVVRTLCLVLNHQNHKALPTVTGKETQYANIY